jgi:hypothetical protein
VADAGVFHLHEDFVGTGLWDGDLFVHGWTAFLFDDLCPLGLWDPARHERRLASDCKAEPSRRPRRRRHCRREGLSRAYCWNVPSTVYPDSCASGHSGSSAVLQNSHARQEKYTGVCHTDLHAMNGDWPLTVKQNLVGGHEGAGNARQDPLSHLMPAWSPISIPCAREPFATTMPAPSWPLCPDAQLSGYTVDGTFQQYAIGKAAHVAKLPKDVEPFNACVVADLNTLRERALRDDNAGAFVAAD